MRARGALHAAYPPHLLLPLLGGCCVLLLLLFGFHSSLLHVLPKLFTPVSDDVKLQKLSIPSNGSAKLVQTLLQVSWTKSKLALL